jgi:hypothetical protein
MTVNRGLAEAAIRNLAGRKVQVVWDIPFVAQADGATMQTESGLTVIQIKPWISDDAMLYTICHECAHARLHYNKRAVLGYEKLKPGSVQLTNEQLNSWYAQNARKEIEADAQTKYWMRFADEYAFNFGGGWLSARLQVLAAVKIED